MFIASMELSQKSKLDQGESGGSTDKDVLSSTWEESDKACKRETGIKERRRKGKERIKNKQKNHTLHNITECVW
jgi:predicted GIY-YIG superfamily endonuclease